MGGQTVTTYNRGGTPALQQLHSTDYHLTRYLLEYKSNPKNVGPWCNVCIMDLSNQHALVLSSVRLCKTDSLWQVCTRMRSFCSAMKLCNKNMRCTNASHPQPAQIISKHLKTKTTSKWSPERGWRCLICTPPSKHKAGNLTQKLENNNDIKSLSSFLPTQIIVALSLLIFNTYSAHVPGVCKPAL